jgi:hypothetical protein
MSDVLGARQMILLPRDHLKIYEMPKKEEWVEVKTISSSPMPKIISFSPRGRGSKETKQLLHMHFETVPKEFT